MFISLFWLFIFSILLDSIVLIFLIGGGSVTEFILISEGLSLEEFAKINQVLICYNFSSVKNNVIYHIELNYIYVE